MAISMSAGTMRKTSALQQLRLVMVELSPWRLHHGVPQRRWQQPRGSLQ